VELQGVGVYDFSDLINIGILMPIVVVKLEVVDTSFGSAPVNVKRPHLINWEFREIGRRIDEELTAGSHFSTGSVDPAGMFYGVGPAKVIEPSSGPNITKYGSAVAFADFG
jgi:hypothetical protein